MAYSYQEISVTIVNSKYIVTLQQNLYSQIFSNATEYISNNIVPTNYLEGVPYVEIHIQSDEIFSGFGVKPDVNTNIPFSLTNFAQLPDISPYYIESFVKGTPIDDQYFAFFKKFIEDPDDSDYWIPDVTTSQWKVNDLADPNNGLSVCPVSLKRSTYTAYLAQNPVNILSISQLITNVAGTENCLEFQLTPPAGYNFFVNQQYGSHSGFSVYENFCISYNVLKNLN